MVLTNGLLENKAKKEFEMKFVSLEYDEKDRAIITVDSSFLFFKKQTKYLAVEKYVTEFYKWVKLPNKILVGDTLAYQLDTWLKEMK